MIRATTTTALAALLALAAAACGDSAPPPASNRGASGPARPTAPAASAPGAGGGAGLAGSAGDAGAGDASRPPPLEITDSDLTESDRARDPFRNFAREFVPVGPQVQVVENNIKLREYGLDELKLVAVILGTGNPYAMLVDPTNRGTIIRRGDYVGRPDTVSAGEGGMMPHQVPWRVSRIVGTRVRRDADNNLAEEPAEVVFEREDRLNPAARAERVLTLTPGAQATTAPGGAGANGAQPQLPALPSFGPGGSPFLPSLSGGQHGTTTGSSGITPNGTYVQSYTTIVPPQPAQPAPPTTVVVQTGPHGETTVQGQGQGQAPAQQAPQGPPNPYLPPPGGSNVPPPIRVTGSDPFPSSGLSSP